MLTALRDGTVSTSILPRVRGLRLILVAEVAVLVALRCLPAGAPRDLVSHWYALPILALSVLAGYDLRSRWALLLTPLVAWGGLIVVFIMTGNLAFRADLREDPIGLALFLVAPGILYALLAQLGVTLATRRSL